MKCSKTINMSGVKYLVFFMLYFCLFSCSEDILKIKTDALPSDWKTVDNKAYTMNYPITWELDKSGEMGTDFILYSSIETEKDPFKENVKMSTQDLTGQNISLDEYVEVYEGQIKKALKNSKIEESVLVNINGIDIHKIIYTGQQGAFNLKFEQYYCLENEKAYSITLTCEQTSYEKHKVIGEQILNSLHFK